MKARLVFGPRRARFPYAITMIKRLFLTATVLAALAATAVGPASAGSIVVGQPAPEFELPDQDGQLHSLEDYRDKWVVLYFYPKDQTPGCTTEACAFRDNIFAYRDADAQILGVSFDDIESHQEFVEEYGLPFPLLADTEGDAAEAYGVATRMFGMRIARRQTFLIDPDGNVAWHYRDVDPATHSQQVLADILRLQAGKLADAAPAPRSVQ